MEKCWRRNLDVRGFDLKRGPREAQHSLDSTIARVASERRLEFNDDFEILRAADVLFDFDERVSGEYLAAAPEDLALHVGQVLGLAQWCDLGHRIEPPKVRLDAKERELC